MSNDIETMSLDQLLLQAGRIAFLLQQLENTIELCCAFLRIEGIDISVNDLLTVDPERRWQTLGQMCINRSMSHTETGVNRTPWPEHVAH